MPRKKVITEEVSDKKVLTETSDEGSFLAVTDPVTAEIRTEDVSGGEQIAAAQRADVLPAEAEQTADAEEAADGERPAKREYSREERPEVEGILEIQEENNFGFLRFSNFLTSDKDIYVSPTQIRRFNLKTGDKIRGITRLPKEGERFGALLYVLTVNGDEPGAAIRRPDFEDLTPVFPYQRLRLEDGSELRLLSALEVLEARREAAQLAEGQGERALCSNACLLARALESGPGRISVAATRSAFSFCSIQTARRPWSVPTSTAKRLSPARRAAARSLGVSFTLSIGY